MDRETLKKIGSQAMWQDDEPDDGQQRIDGMTYSECLRILDTIEGNWHTTPLTPEQERAVAAHYLFEMH